ncbi:MAG: hypothetical protein ACFFCZ_31660 [Promethearchaeota archaeon]
MKKPYVLVSVLIIGVSLLFSINIYSSLIQPENDDIRVIENVSNIRNEGYKQDSPLPLVSISAPFVYEENVTTVNEAYSDTEDCPWGFAHQAIDFFTFNNSPFQAVADCTLTDKAKFYNSGNGKWQVGLRLDYNSDVFFGYAFEPDSANESHGDQQLAMIPHTEGTQLKKGDLLGNLLAVRDGAHVDWAIFIYETRVCPAPYFTPEAYQSVLNVIKKTHPSWEMCYCNCNQTPVFITKTNTINNTITETITVVKSSWPFIVLPTLVVVSIFIKRKYRTVNRKKALAN